VKRTFHKTLKLHGSVQNAYFNNKKTLIKDLLLMVVSNLHEIVITQIFR